MKFIYLPVLSCLKKRMMYYQYIQYRETILSRTKLLLTEDRRCFNLLMNSLGKYINIRVDIWLLTMGLGVAFTLGLLDKYYTIMSPLSL